jgi:hypothetical protein
MRRSVRASARWSSAGSDRSRYAWPSRTGVQVSPSSCCTASPHGRFSTRTLSRCSSRTAAWSPRLPWPRLVGPPRPLRPLARCSDSRHPALLDALDVERATFVGHDTGGGVALILGIEHPDRVARLVLTKVAAFVASGLPDGIHNASRLSSEFREGIVAPYTNEEGKISLIRNASALNTNHTMALVDRHAEITAPTLVLWGVHDPWQKIEDGIRLAAEIPTLTSFASRRRTGSRKTPHESSPTRSSAFFVGARSQRRDQPGRAGPNSVDPVVRSQAFEKSAGEVARLADSRRPDAGAGRRTRCAPPRRSPGGSGGFVS